MDDEYTYRDRNKVWHRLRPGCMKPPYCAMTMCGVYLPRGHKDAKPAHIVTCLLCIGLS